MSDFNVRSDSVNVEQVMEQIRARIREKRGVDYTEQQIRELAAVKLEKLLDPRAVRSDLLAEFHKMQPTSYSLYEFDENTLFDSHRGIVRFLRRLFRPVFKLFFNANALSQSLHSQVEINRHTLAQIERGNLYYELLHNLVVELTRTTIEVKNIKMRVESLASRLEFNERRARALESAVVYKPSEPSVDETRGRRQPEARPAMEPQRSAAPAPPPATSAQVPPPRTQAPAAAPPEGGAPEGPGQRSRRRRRRRGRRGGASAVSMMTDAAGGTAPQGADVGAGARFQAAAAPEHGDAASAAQNTATAEDARDTRPESIEQAFGSPAHPAEPAEPRSEGSGERGTSAPGPAEPPRPDAPDTDGQ